MAWEIAPHVATFVLAVGLLGGRALAPEGAVTRAHVFDPPPHLASVHEPGSVRDCGSSLSACVPKAATS